MTTETAGKVDFHVGAETYQTWYKVIGDLKSGVRPLVVLHGGPGLSHHYLLPFEDLHTRFDLPVVFYDQIGSNASSHPKHVPPEFWTVDLFVDELDNLVEKLGIRNNFDIAGHSWGGIVAARYASHRHPPGLRHLVLASSTPSIPLWVEGVRSLTAKLPEHVREIVDKHETKGTTDNPEHQQAVQTYHMKHGCQLSPWPQELLTSFACSEANPTVAMVMLMLLPCRLGPKVFEITGTLKDWVDVDQLHTIRCPTLLTHGIDDPAQDLCQAPFFSKIEKVHWVTFAKSSHTPHFEERERYFEIVGKFLTET